MRRRVLETGHAHKTKFTLLIVLIAHSSAWISEMAELEYRLCDTYYETCDLNDNVDSWI